MTNTTKYIYRFNKILNNHNLINNFSYYHRKCLLFIFFYNVICYDTSIFYLFLFVIYLFDPRTEVVTRRLVTHNECPLLENVTRTTFPCKHPATCHRHTLCIL